MQFTSYLLMELEHSKHVFASLSIPVPTRIYWICKDNMRQIRVGPISMPHAGRARSPYGPPIITLWFFQIHTQFEHEVYCLSSGNNKVISSLQYPSGLPWKPDTALYLNSLHSTEHLNIHGASYSGSKSRSMSKMVRYYCSLLPGSLLLLEYTT